MNKFTPTEMQAELGLQINSKKQWLKTFSTGPKRRPAYEVETKTRELHVLEQARAAYQKLSEKRDAA